MGSGLDRLYEMADAPQLLLRTSMNVVFCKTFLSSDLYACVANLEDSCVHTEDFITFPHIQIFIFQWDW